MMLKFTKAQENLRALESAIAEARESYPDADEEALAAYLAPMLQELDELRSRIDAHLEIPKLREDTGLTWVTLRGGRVRDGKAPAHLIGHVLEAVQKGTRQLASWIIRGEPATSRVAQDIADEAGLDLVAFQPGSARLALAPSVTQLRVELGLTLAERGISDLLRVIAWAESDDVEEHLENIIPNPKLRRQVLTRVRELAPSERANYATIEFSGYAARQIGNRTLTVTGAAYDRSTAYLRARSEEEVAYMGQLVAIDIERDVFDLRHEQKRIHCHFEADLLEEAKARIEHFVEVEGTGLFRLDDEDPYRIDVKSLRDLSVGEIRNL